MRTIDNWLWLIFSKTSTQRLTWLKTKWFQHFKSQNRKLTNVWPSDLKTSARNWPPDLTELIRSFYKFLPPIKILCLVHEFKISVKSLKVVFSEFPRLTNFKSVSKEVAWQRPVVKTSNWASWPSSAKRSFGESSISIKVGVARRLIKT